MFSLCRKPLEPAKVSETYESAVGAVRETRLMALLGWGQLQAFKARADQFVNTGIAHTAGKETESQNKYSWNSSNV